MGDTRTKKMASLAWHALEDKKAENITVIDIAEVSVLADYFIIASGKNKIQVQAMADNVEEILGKEGYELKQAEGYQTANWILLDYGDLVIHIFDTAISSPTCLIRKTGCSMTSRGSGETAKLRP